MALTLTTSPEAVGLTKNPAYVQFLSTSYSSLENYRVVLRVLFETAYGSGTYTQIVETEAQPTAAGLTQFNIASVLNAACRNSVPFQVPDLAAPMAYVADTLRRYKIQYFERYGDPQADQSATTSSAYSILTGGVDTHYFGLYNFFDNLDTTNAFLTYYPDGKRIATDQPEFLNFINHTGSTAEFYIAVAQYDIAGDQIGTTSLHWDGSLGGDDPPNLAPWQVGVFPIGPTELNLDADCVKYTVRVHTGTFGLGTERSQLRTYYIETNYQDTPATLIWFNVFQMPAILRCTGNKRKRLTVGREFSDQVLSLGYDPTTQQTIQHSRNWNNPYTYRSGAITPDEADTLQDLLIENALLEYSTDGNYYRLQITENTFDIHETRITPNYLEFTAVRALAPGNYMRLSSTAASEAGDSLWTQNDNGFWEIATGSGFWQLN